MTIARLPPTYIILYGQMRQSNGLSSPSIQPVSVSAGQVNRPFSSNSETLRMKPPSLTANGVSGLKARIRSRCSSVKTGVSHASYLSKTQQNLHFAQHLGSRIFFSIAIVSVVYEFRDYIARPPFYLGIYLPDVLADDTEGEYLYPADEPYRAHCA